MYLSHIICSGLSFCTLLLGLIAIIGDFLVKVSNLDVYKAVFDNTTHAIIGGLTWFIVSLQIRNKNVAIRLYEIFLCAFIASIIDLDHFIMAKSLHLKDATNLQERPPMHCSTFPIVTTIVLILLSKYVMSPCLYHFAWILLAAFASHHTRDATRRGFWFYQFGSTPPIPYYLYVLMTMIIPYVISYVMKLFYVQTKLENVHSIDL